MLDVVLGALLKMFESNLQVNFHSGEDGQRYRRAHFQRIHGDYAWNKLGQRSGGVILASIINDGGNRLHHSLYGAFVTLNHFSESVLSVAHCHAERIIDLALQRIDGKQVSQFLSGTERLRVVINLVIHKVDLARGPPQVLCEGVIELIELH